MWCLEVSIERGNKAFRDRIVTRRIRRHMSSSRRKMSFTPSKEPFRRLLGVVSDRGHSPARAQPSKSRRHGSSKQLLEDERKLAADEMARLQAELAHAHSRIEALQQSLAMAVEAASPRRDHSPAHSSVSSSSPPTSPRPSLAKDGSSNGPTAATSAWDQLEADLLRLQKGSPAMPISPAAGRARRNESGKLRKACLNCCC